MAYIERRRVHDADAHIMEPPNWLRDHADPDIRDRLIVPQYASELVQTGDAGAGETLAPDDLTAVFQRLAERHRSEEFLADEATDRASSTTSVSTVSCSSTRSTTHGSLSGNTRSTPSQSISTSPTAQRAPTTGE